MSEPAKPTDATAPSPEVISATHEALYDEEGSRCEICGCELADDDDDGDGPGKGALVWVRGDERREQETLLCATCATTVGVTALRAWEAEEDEEG
jgi:hypothetical protein